MIIGNLSKRISAVRHLAEILNGSPVVTDRIHYGAGIEIVASGHIGFHRTFVILPRLPAVSQHKARLGYYAGKPFLPSFRSGGIKPFALSYREFIILHTELAVNYIEL